MEPHPGGAFALRANYLCGGEAGLRRRFAALSPSVFYMVVLY